MSNAARRDNDKWLFLITFSAPITNTVLCTLTDVETGKIFSSFTLPIGTRACAFGVNYDAPCAVLDAAFGTSLPGFGVARLNDNTRVIILNVAAGGAGIISNIFSACIYDFPVPMEQGIPSIFQTATSLANAANAAEWWRAKFGTDVVP